ncbi:hypothetical protein ACKWMY_25015 [Serratia sp. J2]|uniref:hypothetical protein n=1 Tax=Serratia sp. J2 TaxID=3386551 RepID=UPI0039173589
MQKLTNSTRNQHYIAQVEQRLNSSSNLTSLSNPRNAKIFEFKISDIKEGSHKPSLKLMGNKSIHSVLSVQDIFTIQHLPNGLSVNFESLFQRYENDFSNHVNLFLDCVVKIKDTIPPDQESIESHDTNLQGYIKCVYKYKIMNWLRNPFHIKTVLKNFSPFGSYVIQSQNGLDLYNAIDTINQSQCNYICTRFSISIDEYKEWLRLILLFLYQDSSCHVTVLDDYVDNFFSATDLSTSAYIFYYDTDSPLLPDSAIVVDEVKGNPSFYMNISKNCLLLIQHVVIDNEQSKERMDKIGVSEEQREKLNAMLAGNKRVKVFLNDLRVLNGFNEFCVGTASSVVYSSSNKVHDFVVE